jgi:hypothetical protein
MARFPITPCTGSILKKVQVLKMNFNIAMRNYFPDETCSENYNYQQLTSAIRYRSRQDYCGQHATEEF